MVVVEFLNRGEISLAHLGVLFLDEIPEFKHEVLEVMRAPLEDRKVTLSRVFSTLTYPCDFMMIASMNPCPCGYYGSNLKECSCSADQINKYMNRLSGPLLDRIDIHIEVQAVKYEALSNTRPTTSSKEIKERVNRARKIQLKRYENDGIFSNSQLNSSLISKYCQLTDDCREILKTAFNRLGLSARAHDRILKLARTIADLEESENIEMKHLAEAIQYRSLDRKYWG